MNPRIIVIDGITYHSVDEMPADIRQKYEQAMQGLGDANNNQIPDAFESLNLFADKDGNGAPDMIDKITASHAAVNSIKIVVDGKEFDGLDNLPPEVRARYEEAMHGLDANGNGVPDFVEGVVNPPGQRGDAAATLGSPTSRRSSLLPSSPTTTPDTSNGWMLILTGLFIFATCVAGAAAVWYFFLR